MNKLFLLAALLIIEWSVSGAQFFGDSWTASTGTFGDGSSASYTLTYNLSGATDPQWTAGDNSLDLTTGVLKYGGNTVLTTGSGANPSASLGLSAVNGSATTFLRSDGAPALSQSIAPTWTGDHIFSPSNGTPVTITPAADTKALVVNGISITGSGATTGLDLSGTWNTSGKPSFETVNLTNTASGWPSYFRDWQVSGSSKLSLRLDGSLFASGTANTTYYSVVHTNTGMGYNSGTLAFFYQGVLVSAFTLPSANEGSLYLYNRANSAYSTRLTCDQDTGLVAGMLQIGGSDAAAPVAGGVKGADGSGTDKAGGDWYSEGGQSTGTGAGGSVITRTTPSSTTGSSANSYSIRSYQSAKGVSLTESSATLFANVSLASSKYLGAELVCTIDADDATDFQALTSVVNISGVNKGGTVTASLTQVDGTTAASTGTLTCTYTAVANGNGVDIKANAVSSLTQTTLKCRWIITALNSDGVATVTPQ